MNEYIASEEMHYLLSQIIISADGRVYVVTAHDPRFAAPGWKHLMYSKPVGPQRAALRGDSGTIAGPRAIIYPSR